MRPRDMVLAVALLSLSLAIARAGEPDHRSIRDRCLAVLREGIRSDEFWPSMHAAEALTLSGRGEEVIAALRDRLPMETDDQRRCGLARELVRAGDRDRLPLLLEILKNQESSGRVHAAESLYKLGESGDGKALRAAFEQPDQPQLRLMSAAALARAGDTAALTFLRSELASDDRSRRNTAAFALARLGDESDVQLLFAALDGEKDLVGRAFLINALANLRNQRGREELARNLKSPDVAVRALSAEFAGHSGLVECREELIRMLDDPGHDVRIRAAQALIEMSLPATKR